MRKLSEKSNPSKLEEILKQKPLIVESDTELLSDTAARTGQPFDKVFNEAVQRISKYPPRLKNRKKSGVI